MCIRDSYLAALPTPASAEAAARRIHRDREFTRWGDVYKRQHEWSGLYLSPEFFRRRMEALRRAKCSVLRLQDAVPMLYAGTLPPRAVVITFDDGFYDFAARAWPVLREFQYPATVYFTTYYSIRNMPVFDLMRRYLAVSYTHLQAEERHHETDESVDAIMQAVAIGVACHHAEHHRSEEREQNGGLKVGEVHLHQFFLPTAISNASTMASIFSRPAVTRNLVP